MKFSMPKEELLDKISLACKIITQVTPYSYLENLKIEVNETSIILITSNTYVSLRVSIPANEKTIIEETGVVYVTGKKILDCIKRLDSQVASIYTIDDKILHITDGVFSADNNLINKENCVDPSFTFNTKTCFSLSRRDLKTIIKEVNFCVANPAKSEKELVTGMSFINNGGVIRFTGTDTLRIAEKKIIVTSPEGEDSTLEDFKVIIPKKSLDDVNKIIEDEGNDIKIYVDYSQVVFQIDDVIFQTRLIEGIFPSIEKVIPKTFCLEVTVNREELIKKLEDASVMSNDNIGTKQCVVLNKTLENEILFTSFGGTKGKSTSKIKLLFSSNFDKFDLHIDARSMIECLKAISSVNIDLKFVGRNQKLMMTIPNEDNLFYIMQPLINLAS